MLFRGLKMTNSDKSNPLVSVVLPTYNRAHLLGKAIQSILSQTYQNFEIIVVDDCSHDNTEEVVRGFADERIRFFNHEKNQGAIAARNTGIKASKGGYIAFQDSDNEWLPEKLEKQIKAFESGSPKLGVAYTSVWLIDNGIRTRLPSLSLTKTDGEIHDLLLEGNFIDTSTALVKRDCFEKVGLFEKLPRLQEWGLWLRISKYYTFKHINEPLLCSYRQPDSISKNINGYIIARKYIVNKYFDEISQRPKLLARYYFGIGNLLCSKGDAEGGHTYFLKAIRVYPFNAELLFSTFSLALGIRIHNKIAQAYMRAKGQEL